MLDYGSVCLTEQHVTEGAPVGITFVLCRSIIRTLCIQIESGLQVAVTTSGTFHLLSNIKHMLNK